MHKPNMREARNRHKQEVLYLDCDNSIKTDKFVGKKYFLKTYGCQMNVHDSEQIRAYLESFGLIETEVLEEANVIVLNTCAIRENAHDKVFGYLGRCKHLKKAKKDVIVALGGCMSQEENVVKLVEEKYPYVDIVFGTHNIHDLPRLLIENTGKQNIEVYSVEGNVYENTPYKRDSKITAWVNIMYGCDKFCTYCIVPYTRGKQRSRRSSEIIKEVKSLVEEGYQEVTLLGQNVNAYGKDLPDEMSFAKLLEQVSLTNIPRIRFVTSHPWDFTDEMIDVIAKYSNIMPYIHLPIQSGSNRILKLMGRRYTKEKYQELFNKIKSKIPNATITTDIIVGFPDETEEDFNETLDIVNYCKFDGAYTFIYSPREGTPAATMPDNTSLEEKENRLQRLNKLVNNYSLKSNQKYYHQTVKVLVTGVSEKDSSKVVGYSEEMKLVNIEAPLNTIGKIIDVYITDCKSFSLDGKIKEQ